MLPIVSLALALLAAPFTALAKPLVIAPTDSDAAITNDVARPLVCSQITTLTNPPRTSDLALRADFSTSATSALYALPTARRFGSDRILITPTFVLNAAFAGPVANCSSTYFASPSPQVHTTIVNNTQTFSRNVTTTITSGSATASQVCFRAENRRCPFGYRSVDVPAITRFGAASSKVRAPVTIAAEDYTTSVTWPANFRATLTLNTVVNPGSTAWCVTMTASGFPNQPEITNGPATFSIQATYAVENLTCTSFGNPSPVLKTSYTQLLPSTSSYTTQSIGTPGGGFALYNPVLSVTGRPNAVGCPAGYTSFATVGATRLVAATVTVTATGYGTTKSTGTCTVTSLAFSGVISTIVPTAV
ncbi:hypothetical protein BJ742DRAFT_779282 [Cladochytrium replicatum]|nr:hypothetical protein BJ742DRAFT_779282 [Cladochytrium replicatum]